MVALLCYDVPFSAVSMLCNQAKRTPTLFPRDVLMAALAAALPEEALPACKKLDLDSNKFVGALELRK